MEEANIKSLYSFLSGWFFFEVQVIVIRQSRSILYTKMQLLTTSLIVNMITTAIPHNIPPLSLFNLAAVPTVKQWPLQNAFNVNLDASNCP